MQSTTLVLLIKRDDTHITDILLAMKKRGFGMGRYNGVGGKLEKGESIEDAARRETFEEISVTAHQLKKCAELTFFTPHRPEWNQVVHVFLADSWESDPQESEEMRPKWFSTQEIPYASMWPDDAIWMPRVLLGEFVTGTFTFAEDGSISSHTLSLSE